MRFQFSDNSSLYKKQQLYLVKFYVKDGRAQRGKIGQVGVKWVTAYIYSKLNRHASEGTHTVAANPKSFAKYGITVEVDPETN